MTAIFRDAAIPLREITIPSSPWSSNTKRSRIPTSQAKNIHFGTFYPESIRNNSNAEGLLPIELPSDMKSPIQNISSPSYRVVTPPEIPYGLQFPPLPYRDSSPFPQPVSAYVKGNPDVTYPNLDAWAGPRSPSGTLAYDSADEDCHSSHGVPLILPVRHQPTVSSPETSVHKWLESVSVSSSTEPSSPQQSDPPTHVSVTANSTPPTVYTSSPKLPSRARKAVTVSSTSSNKENNPPKDSSSATSSPSPQSSPSIRPPSTAYLSANLARCGVAMPSPPRPPAPSPERKSAFDPPPPYHHRSDAPSPSPGRLLRPRPGYLTRSPKRQRAQTSTDSEHGRAIPVPDPKPTFTIYEDDDVAQLSPGVERHRKGRGPKRERCVSYWDEDVIGRGTSSVSAGGEEEKPGGLEMVELGNGKHVLIEREVGVHVDGDGEVAVEQELEWEGQMGRERRYEFMVGKRGRGFD
ncbi:MAG: hypothetical protein Q9195_002691 [Heterodermia aff. obscurata]